MKEVVRQEIIRINKTLKRLDTFGIAFSEDQRELEGIIGAVEFLKAHNLVTQERIQMWESTIEDIQARQECLEEEQASLGYGWW